MIKTILKVSLCLMTLSGFSQDLWLDSKGKLPKEILPQYKRQIVEENNVSIFNQSYNTYQRAKFAEKNDYYIEEMLTNGGISFGDTITEYLTDLLHYLQEAGHNTKDLNVYLMKEPDANAFMTHSGNLLVTNALVAHAENEAQLAFILAHEIIHKEREHIEQEFEYDLTGAASNEDNFSPNPKLKLYKYSKKFELEADKLALEDFIQSTTYDIDSISGVFNMLMRGHLPLGEVVFDSSFFDADSLHFKYNLFLKEVDEISTFEDYNDSRSTHPNVKVRKKQFNKIVAEFDSTKHVDTYIFGKERFEYISNLAKDQLLIDQIREREYGIAIQNALYLKTKFPEKEAFYDQVIAHCLYATMVYKNSADFSEIKYPIKYTEGELQQITHLINETDDDEFNALVLRKLYSLKNKYPEDQKINQLYEDAFHTLIYTHRKDLEDYSLIAQADAPTADTLTDNEFNLLTKANKEKHLELLKEEAKNEDYIEFVFTDLLNDSTTNFKKEFEDLVYQRDSVDEDEETTIDITALLNALNVGSLEIKKPDSVIIEKMITIHPKSFFYDTRRDPKLQIDKTLKTRDKLNASVVNAFKHSEIDGEFLFYDNLKSSDIEEANDLMFLQSWFNERVEHEEKDIPMSNQARTDQIIEKYGTQYVYYPNFVGVRLVNDKLAQAGVSLISIVGIPAVPYLLIESFIAQHESLYYGFVFDLETGKAIHVEIQVLKSTVGSDYLSSMIYKTLTELQAHE